MEKKSVTYESNKRMAKQLWHQISPASSRALRQLTCEHQLSVAAGEILLIDGRWYVSHTGLLVIARRGRCAGIHVQPVPAFCNASAQHWAFAATVYKSKTCRGFVGYGDADPSNVSFLVHGAEMRIAETRAVNRALRKAYGIGICSVEEIGSCQESKKLPPQPVNGHHGSPKLRDRLSQVIRQYQLDPSSVKSYATEFCGVKALRDATREQVETFVVHLADWAEKDRNALVCQLNSCPGQKEGAV